VANADATINVRVGGHRPAVVLIHGFGETGDMRSPMAAELAKDHTVSPAATIAAVQGFLAAH
jgi:pimeloyl-ACP methyl ester carboxylesterase